jgi:hypothetical protein
MGSDMYMFEHDEGPMIRARQLRIAMNALVVISKACAESPFCSMCREAVNEAKRAVEAVEKADPRYSW